MDEQLSRLVRGFRHSSPFIHAHRGRTFVVSFGGEALTDTAGAGLVHDLALLSGLGIRLVLVPGARPQIEQRLAARGTAIEYVNGLRVTTPEALEAVRDAIGSVRLELEARFSMGLANSPMAGVRLPVASGNFVTARPLGVRDGVDHQLTGEVRRIDAAAIRARLDEGAVVIVSPLGVSPTGEQFNLYAEDVAVSVARVLQADKLIFLHEGEGMADASGSAVGELTIEQAEALLANQSPPDQPSTTPATGSAMAPANANALTGELTRGIEACRSGVSRVHLLPRAEDGVLLAELFTRDGVGTLITARAFERLRAARIDDISGILSLIEPLERDGTLVARTRERLETDIEDFTVMEREGTVVACAALHVLPESDVGELACLVVHPDYRGGHRGARLLQQIERLARDAGCRRLVVLTTRTAHWFQEKGFEPDRVETLPASRQAFYNLARGSKVFSKAIAG